MFCGRDQVSQANTFQNQYAKLKRLKKRVQKTTAFAEMGDKNGPLRPKPNVSPSRKGSERRELQGAELLAHQASQMSHTLFIARRSSSLILTDPQVAHATRNSVRLSNPRMSQVKTDRLFYLGVDIDDINTPEQFGDIKFVVIGESMAQMVDFAQHLAGEDSDILVNLARGGDSPYVMYKVDNALILSHSMGSPSISILLNELLKLLHLARCHGTIFIRIGQSGGVGVRPGSVIVTNQVFDAQLRNSHEVVVLGKPQLWPAKLDSQVGKQLIDVNVPAEDGFEAISGNTMSTNDFYEGQFRLDGAFADYNEMDKQLFLAQLVEKGIMNIEMESAAFAALTHKANIRSAIVCMTNLNRLNGDAITATTEQLNAWYKRPQKLVSRYIKQTWNRPSSTTKVNFTENPRKTL